MLWMSSELQECQNQPRLLMLEALLLVRLSSGWTSFAVPDIQPAMLRTFTCTLQQIEFVIHIPDNFLLAVPDPDILLASQKSLAWQFLHTNCFQWSQMSAESIKLLDQGSHNKEGCWKSHTSRAFWVVKRAWHALLHPSNHTDLHLHTNLATLIWKQVYVGLSVSIIWPYLLLQVHCYTSAHHLLQQLLWLLSDLQQQEILHRDHVHPCEIVVCRLDVHLQAVADPLFVSFLQDRCLNLQLELYGSDR